MRELMLPKGQYYLDDMPRFGLTQFAERFPSQIKIAEISILGNVEKEFTFNQELATLPRKQVTADFHCVTTWSTRAQNWEGILFKDFYHNLIAPISKPSEKAQFIVLRGQDGARSSLPLDDLLKDNVILADRQNGEPLSIKNGAPIRLIAPDHYAYKSVKHLNRIEFHDDNSKYQPSALRFMDHPRARVALEERGQFFPGWMLRYAYKPLINPTIRKFKTALKKHLSSTSQS